MVPGSGMSRALFGNNFRIRNRRNKSAERRPMNFKFFNGVGVFSGLGVDYEYREAMGSDITMITIFSIPVFFVVCF